jgi:hypothetical protein
METIKIIVDELNIKEVCLQATGYYTKDNTTINKNDYDITITITFDEYTDKIYGREIDNKYYFARVQHINHFPYIDYYTEFFSTGEELKF